MDKRLEALRYGYYRYSLLRSWRDIMYSVAELVCSRLSDAEIYVFGSVVDGDYTAASDIDVLIVSRKAPEGKDYAIDLQLYLEDMLKLPPGLLHIHVVNPGSEKHQWFLKALRIKTILVKKCRGKDSASSREG